MNVYYYGFHDSEWPDRVAFVILAKDRYNAADMAEDYCETQGILFDPNNVSEAYESDQVEEVYKI